MTRQLVLIHGRSQQLKDAVTLKQTWLTALEQGLAANGLTLPIPETAVRFAYYGNALAASVKGIPAKDADKVIIRGPAQDLEELPFLTEALREILPALGITEQDIALAQAELAGGVHTRGPQDWGWVQAVAKVLDQRLPGTTATLITLALKDVYLYLVARETRTIIDDGVAAAFTPQVETVVVGHSLGSVVAYNLLRERAERDGWQVPLLVTLGSPLGISKVKGTFLPPRWPQGVQTWFNARDHRDLVALFPLTKPHFGVGSAHEIANKDDVDNPTSNRHGITGYLSDPVVARTIYDALTG